MKLLKKFAVLVLVILPIWSFAQCNLPVDKVQPKQIALTFDDAPRGDGAFYSGKDRTDALINSLRVAGVDEALFFVTTNHINKYQGHDRLQRYTDAGHSLANHSHSHQWLRNSSAKDYLADVSKAQELLEDFDNVLPLFRFPFLNEGKDAEQRDAVRAGLTELGLRNGYVTIDNYDWYIEALASRLKKSGAEFELEAMADFYVETLVSAAEFYDAMAVEHLSYRPKHVLLLHENDLAALFVDDLVYALRDKGWQIIPASEAYQDAIAECQPDTMFLGQGRVAALAAADGVKRRTLIHPSEDEAFLELAFAAKVGRLATSEAD